MTTTMESLKSRTEFIKKYITDMLRDTGLCIYGVNNETGEIYLADRKDAYEGNVSIAAGIKIDQLNNLF